MNDKSTVRRSAWRFSLRELLLMMLAAAAFIGWGALLYRTGRLRPTQICVMDAGDEHVGVIITMQEARRSGGQGFGLITGG